MRSRGGALFPRVARPHALVVHGYLGPVNLHVTCHFAMQITYLLDAGGQTRVYPTETTLRPEA